MPEKKKPNSGSFAKGKSGNPVGRPKGVPNKSNAELRAYAGQYTIEAVDGLVSIARNEEMPPAARVMAWDKVLDRAHGKAPQAVSDTDGNAVSIPAAIAFLIRQQPGSENRT